MVDTASTDEPTRPEGTLGRTLVKARFPYEYHVQFDENLPVITQAGVLLTAEIATRVVAEAEAVPDTAGVVFIDTEKETD